MTTEDFKHLEIKSGLRNKKSRLFAEKGYQAQLQDFVDALRKGRTPSVTVVDGVRSTIGCLRLAESCRTLLPQRIDLDAVLA